MPGDPWGVGGPGPHYTSPTNPRGIKIGGSFPQNTRESNPCNCRMDSLMFLNRAVSGRRGQAAVPPRDRGSCNGHVVARRRYRPGAAGRWALVGASIAWSACWPGAAAGPRPTTALGLAATTTRSPTTACAAGPTRAATTTGTPLSGATPHSGSWSTAAPASSRHAHLGPAARRRASTRELGEANVAQRALVAWAAERGIQADWTEDVAQLDSPGKLLRYDGVVFLSTSRDILDDAAQTSLTQYMRAGGGFVSIHNTLGAEYNWPYFQGLLGGANFYDHGPHRTGSYGRSTADASTPALPREWASRTSSTTSSRCRRRCELLR